MIRIMEEGRAALEKVNKEMGLALDDWDLDYYTTLFTEVRCVTTRHDITPPPTASLFHSTPQSVHSQSQFTFRSPAGDEAQSDVGGGLRHLPVQQRTLATLVLQGAVRPIALHTPLRQSWMIGRFGLTDRCPVVPLGW